MVTCVSAHDPQLARLADAIAQRVGQQRFHVWFNNSTRLDLRQDGLEIAVPNDFISEWIGKNFTRPIQEAAHEVLGCPLPVRFSVVPELFETDGARTGQGSKYIKNEQRAHSATAVRPLVVAPIGAPAISRAVAIVPPTLSASSSRAENSAMYNARPKLRHDLDNYIVGASNQLAYNAACYVSEFP